MSFLWNYLLLLLLLLSISWSVLCRQDVHASVWRKGLQKEVLLNSIAYLRRELFSCLKVTQSARGKVSYRYCSISSGNSVLVYLSVCLCDSSYLSIYLSNSIHCPSICLSACLSLFLPSLLVLSIYLSIYLSICLSVYLSISFPTLFICLSACRVSIYLSIILSIYV